MVSGLNRKNKAAFSNSVSDVVWEGFNAKRKEKVISVTQGNLWATKKCHLISNQQTFSSDDPI